MDVINFSASELIVALFPTCYEEYWFFTAYFLMLCGSPLINAGLLAIRKQTYRNGLFLFVAIWSFIPIISSAISLVSPNVSQATLYSNPLLQLLLIYCIGAYIRLYEPKIINRRNGLIMISCSFVVLFASVVLINLAEYHGWITSYLPNMLFDRLSPLTILCACGMFSICLDSKATHVNVINRIASCVFGVYLIHDNPYMRELVWGRIFNNSLVDEKLLLLHMIVSILIVFLACMLIELTRKQLVEYPFKRVLDCIERVFRKNHSH